MSTVIVIGVPSGVKDRLFAAIRLGKVSLLPGWQYIWIPSKGRPFETNLDKILSTLTCLENEGPHVLAFKPPDPVQREELMTKVRPFFRFKWLLNRFGMPDLENTVISLVEYLNSILKQEEWWEENLKPADVSSPLLLPETCFSCSREVADLWELAHRGEEPAQSVFEKKLELFTGAYLKKSSSGKVWQDEKNNVFNWHGSRHAENPFPHYWKMSFRVPDGFHYDVESKKFPKCELRCATGKWFKHDYLNIDIHGRISARGN